MLNMMHMVASTNEGTKYMVEINAFIREVERFKNLKPDMQIITMLTFLYIARRGVCVQKDIEYELKVSNAAASRNINYWCATGPNNFNMVERYEDPSDRRNNMLRLTREGLEFYNLVTGRNAA